MNNPPIFFVMVKDFDGIKAWYTVVNTADRSCVMRTQYQKLAVELAVDLTRASVASYEDNETYKFSYYDWRGFNKRAYPLVNAGKLETYEFVWAGQKDGFVIREREVDIQPMLPYHCSCGLTCISEDPGKSPYSTWENRSGRKIRGLKKGVCPNCGTRWREGPR